MTIATTEERYNVYCMSCDQVWTPAPRSPLWWRAKKAADRGRLDAIYVTGEECGCIQRQCRPDAPFRVFGYDDLLENFDIPCNTFVQAIKTYRNAERSGCVVFIKGVSAKVEDRL